jgi:hypothetical protein
MKGAGLLALGEFGKGLAGGMTEAIKYEILKRRDDALFQREKTLEEYRHVKIMLMLILWQKKRPGILN